MPVIMSSCFRDLSDEHISLDYQSVEKDSGKMSCAFKSCFKVNAGTLDILNIIREKMALREKRVKIYEKCSATLRFIPLAARKKIIHMNTCTYL